MLKLPAIVLTCLALRNTSLAAAPGELPSQGEILRILHKVIDWQSAHPVMAPDDRN